MIIDDIGMENYDEEDGEMMGNGSVSESEEDDTQQQPPATSVIVTNLVLQIFDDPDERELFEVLFQDIDETVTFQYFKSFRRVRVNFTTAAQAAEARTKVHMMEYKGEIIKCYFTQPIVLGSKLEGGPHLQPPKRDKQFLISPPASPPVGWEPVEEAEPIVNYDLIAAVANLAPGESHELHPPMEDKPGIIVHICEEAEEQGNGPRPRIIQTRRPQSSS
ncbi:calcipressin-1 [Macrobrachium rosenbergii]|uniref:calcipressin-1 n=1 Tax=Macrobrachium rosenbergii TaxID=79674 RepID=UPI0034D49AD4